MIGQSAFAQELAHSDARKPKKTPVATIGGDPKPYLFEFKSVVRNIPQLEDAASGRGMITVKPDSDGVVRRVPAVLNVNGNIYPSLVIEMFRVATGQKAYAVRSNKTGIESVIIKPNRVPTDANGRIWVYFSPHAREKRYVSAADVINGTVPVSRIQNKLVLVGTSATGMLDIRVTPVDDNLPGVEVHANMIETILAGAHLSRPADSLGKEIVAALVAGLLMIILVPLIGAGWTLGLLAVLFAALVGTSWYTFTGERELIDITYPGISTFLLYSLFTYTSYSKTAAERKQVRGAFSQYLSPALLAQLADEPDRLALGGEMKDMTFLFADVRGFTTISEQFKEDPQGLTSLINRFLTPMTDMILSRRGTIDKYMGDCIMAFWNAPLDDDDHARHACDSALAMMGALAPVNESIKTESEAEGRPYYPINIGIGVNSGEVVVGNMGSDQRFDYSVLGDAVNLASRLEGQSKNYGVHIVIGEDTYARVQDLAVIELDLIAVKGKTEAVRIFTLLGDADLKASSEHQTLAARHGDMIKAYRSQEWGTARSLIKECRTLDGSLETLYELYEERLDIFEADPPGPEWDGVFVATSK